MLFFTKMLKLLCNFNIFVPDYILVQWSHYFIMCVVSRKRSSLLFQSKDSSLTSINAFKDYTLVQWMYHIFCKKMYKKIDLHYTLLCFTLLRWVPITLFYNVIHLLYICFFFVKNVVDPLHLHFYPEGGTKNVWPPPALYIFCTPFGVKM